MNSDFNKKNTEILDGITPFNDVYYLNCIYNSLFPIIRYLGENEIKILINDIPLYRKQNGQNYHGLEVAYKSCEPFETLMGNMGINCDTKTKSENVIEDITNAISNKRPVIVYIDCFYEPLRIDTYQKMHFPHSLLIYGFNSIEKTFNIIEHKHRDILLYERRTISYQDLLNSYNGYVERFQSFRKGPSYYEFYRNPLSEYGLNAKQDCTSQFLTNMKNNQKDILSSLECLDEFVYEYRQIVLDKPRLDNCKNELVENINEVINYKNTEKYIISKLLSYDPFFKNVLEDTIKKWNNIRYIIVKYVYSTIYNYDAFTSSVDQVHQIYCNECKYYDKLFELF